MILLLGCHDKTKTHFKGIILLHQLNIKLVASPEKERREMKLSPLFSGASFPINTQTGRNGLVSLHRDLLIASY